MDFNDYIQQGYKYYQEENFDKALENYQAALKLQPNNEEVKYILENTKMQEEYAAKADQALKNEIKQRLSLEGITESNIEQAIAEAAKSLKSNPNDTSEKNFLKNAYYIRGMMFMSKKEFIRAIKDFDEAINNEPNFVYALIKRVQLNLKVENYDQAIKDCEKLIQIKPNDDQGKLSLSNAYLQRGISFDKKKDYNNAIPDYEKALKYNPDDNSARELLAMRNAEITKK
jgi:tetratricopeptide (TPR) repeat protein